MAKKRRSRGQRMRALGSHLFTGRREQVQTFYQALAAVTREFAPPFENTKTVLAISGEGGMGKTTLLWEFERTCSEREILSVYLDMSRHEGPDIHSIVDFLHVLRRWFPPLKGRFIFAKEPFEEFDDAYAKLLKLEQQLKNFEIDKKESPSAIEHTAELLSRAAVGFGKELPGGQTIVDTIGEETVHSTTNWALRSTLGWGRELMHRAFDKPQDVDFYLSHEERLIEHFVEAVELYVEDKPIVILIDSYEYIMHLDVALREQLLKQFPETIPLVFSGRNSLYDNCSLGWRDDTHFFELREFTAEETLAYLQKEQLDDVALSQAIYQFTNGVPLAVAMAADVVDRLGGVEEATRIFVDEQEIADRRERHKIIEKVAKRFLNLVEPAELEAIYLSAVLGQIDYPNLQELLQEPFTQEDFDDFETYSFMCRSGGAYIMHDTVREFVLRNLKHQEPTHYQQLQTQAAEYFVSQRENLGGNQTQYEDAQWRRLTLESTYHFMQADGVESLYPALADAFWEEEYRFARSLIILCRRTPEIAFPLAEPLVRICDAFATHKYQVAADTLEQLLPATVSSPYLQQICHELLGQVYSENRLNQIDTAIDYMLDAIGFCRAIEKPEWAAWTQVKIGEQLREKEAFQQALEQTEAALARFEQDKNPERIARTKLNIGMIYRHWGKYPEAKEHLLAAKAEFSDLTDQVQVADVLWELGILHRRWHKYDESITYLTESRDLYRTLGRLKDEAHLWSHLGTTYRMWSKYDRAIEYYQTAQERYEPLDDQTNRAAILLETGGTYRDWGKHQAAVADLTQSRQLYEQLERQHQAANLTKELGTTYQNWGKTTEALTHYQSALAQYEKVADHVQMAQLKWSIGNVLRTLDRYQEAISALHESRAAFEELGYMGKVAKLWNSLAITYRAWRKYEEAIEHFQQAQQRFRQLGRQDNVADNLWELGITYRLWNRYDEAVGYLIQSRDLYEELDDLLNVANLWDSLASIYRTWGKYEEAIEHYQQAQQRFLQLDRQDSVADNLWELGITYRLWNRYEEAVEYLTQGRDFYEQLDDLLNVANLWDHLGITYHVWGKYKEAIEHFQQAQKHFQELDCQDNVADNLWELGLTYRSWNRYEESVEHLTQSRDLYEQLDLPLDAANRWNDLGITYDDWGKYEEAIEHYQQAQQRFQELDRQDSVAVMLVNIGLAYRGQDRYEESVKYLRQSRDLYEQLDLPLEVANRWNDLGIIYRNWGKYEEAADHYQQAQQRYQQLDRQHSVANV